MRARTPLLLAIRAYQRLVSPLLGAHCRFIPSCSEYAHLAIEEWGALRGTILAAKRVLSCHPWSEGGFDMPPRNEVRNRG